MIIRIKFAKYGLMRFIGHLDVMRYFQKAIRRSGIDAAYTQGFHPHQIMSFASPLGMGITSDGEYVDIELNSMTSIEDIFSRLSGSLSDGFSLINISLLDERETDKKKEAAMSLITCADYLVMINSDKGFQDKASLDLAIQNIMQRDSINVTKSTKSGESQLDIKPYIYAITSDYDTFTGSTQTVPASNNQIEHAEVRENDILLYLRISSGSKMNIKPELILSELYEASGIANDRYSYRIHRMELYAGTEKFIPLEKIK